MVFVAMLLLLPLSASDGSLVSECLSFLFLELLPVPLLFEDSARPRGDEGSEAELVSLAELVLSSDLSFLDLSRFGGADNMAGIVSIEAFNGEGE